MTIINCPHKGFKALCPKCGRMSPNGCWMEELADVVANGSPLQKEIYVELHEIVDEGVVAREAAKLEGIPAAPKRVEPSAPKKATRGKKPYKAGVAK